MNIYSEHDQGLIQEAVAQTIAKVDQGLEKAVVDICTANAGRIFRAGVVQTGVALIMLPINFVRGFFEPIPKTAPTRADAPAPAQAETITVQAQAPSPA